MNTYTIEIKVTLTVQVNANSEDQAIEFIERQGMADWFDNAKDTDTDMEVTETEEEQACWA
jgi:hypothetical protein